MSAHALATLKFALRTPMTWGLMLGAAVAGWFAASFDVLALDESAAAPAGVFVATAQFAGAILVAWLIARSLDEDATSGWTAAVDSAQPGHRVRHIGRWAGATAAAGLSSIGAIILSSVATRSVQSELLSLVCTTIVALGLVGAWAMLLSVRWRGGGAILVAVLIWFAGHLPWGHAQFVPGLGGRVLRAWLPAPHFDPASIASWTQHGLATAGLLMLCTALSRPGTS